jgi:hypothetical protein
MLDSPHCHAQPTSPRVSTSLPELTGADALFDVLLESLVPQISRDLPQLSAQEVYARMNAFRPRFEAVYCNVLQEYLGADRIPELVRELMAPAARAYFAARRSMSPELGRCLRELTFEMGKITL